MSIYDSIDFQHDVIGRSHEIPVIVDFWAEWCEPCRVLGPVLERLAERSDGTWELRKVDTEAFPDVARTYGIRSIPNVKLFSKGTPINQFVGALPASAIEQWLRTALPDPFETVLNNAEALLQNHKRVEARSVLESILAESPGHERARILLALALFFEDRDKARSLLANLEPVGLLGERVSAFRTFDDLLEHSRPDSLAEAGVKAGFLSAVDAFSRQDFDTALGLFIEVIKADRYFNDDRSRMACIAIFKYLGEEHEITLKHRRTFDRSF
jgi:putative thioredoxin